MSNPHIGSEFDDFLVEEDLLADCQAEAIKRVIAWQIEEYMKEKHLSKKAFAEQLHTSRSALDRLLDPDNTSVNLNTLANAVAAIGKKLEIRIA